jgi:hypothetical protein
VTEYFTPTKTYKQHERGQAVTLRQHEPPPDDPVRLKLTPWLDQLKLDHRIPGNDEAALHLVAFIRRYALERFSREYEQLNPLERSYAIEEGSRLFNLRFIPILSGIALWIHMQVAKYGDQQRTKTEGGAKGRK